MNFKATMMTAAVMVWIAGTAVATEPAAQPAPTAKGEPTNGGKPQPPVDVAFDWPTAVHANIDLKVSAKVTCRQDCTHLTVEVRGLDGLTAKSTRKDHGSSPAGKLLSHDAVVHVPAEAAGMVVVDVSMLVKGKKYSTSRTFPIKAEGAPATQPPPPIGHLETDAQGNKLEVMPVKETKAK